MSERTPEPGWFFDENGWSQRLPISDKDCILLCLRNAPEGTERKQVERLIKSLEHQG